MFVDPEDSISNPETLVDLSDVPLTGERVEIIVGGIAYDVSYNVSEDKYMFQNKSMVISDENGIAELQGNLYKVEAEYDPVQTDLLTAVKLADVGGESVTEDIVTVTVPMEETPENTMETISWDFDDNEIPDGWTIPVDGDFELRDGMIVSGDPGDGTYRWPFLEMENLETYYGDFTLEFRAKRGCVMDGAPILASGTHPVRSLCSGSLAPRCGCNAGGLCKAVRRVR